ncbi:MAG TPA: hypothetical protein VJV76_00255 [Gaiellaceae bacterium]|nr:hypothetical protein [Gaiellaceae bacterium]
MPTETVIALGLTLVSAVAINWGYLLEHEAASRLPALSVRTPARTVRVLLGSRGWLSGFALETSGFILYVVALALAPLALVQSVAAGGIGVLAVLVARISGTPLQARERAGVGIAIMGLVLLAISLAGGSGQGVAGTWYGIGLWLAASVGAAALALTVGVRPMPGGAAFGLAAGILFAAGDIATKAVVSGGNHLLLGPAMIGFYAGGTMVLQSGFQRGRALTTAGIATLATNAIPIAAAMTLFREPLPSGILGVTRVAAFASVVIGAVWLAPKRPDTSAEAPSSGREDDIADEGGIQADPDEDRHRAVTASEAEDAQR